MIIADTYQIIGEIGSGGGGIVYLAEHLRLYKKVILKADKKTVAMVGKSGVSSGSPPQSSQTRLENLRREADSLKNLHHSNIPQVYDFVVENEIVYTVMDYIDGNSLDNLLKMDFNFNQAQIINMARQLLEALIYLHSRPPHGILHADIKPANVMITPHGETYLIDYNIALALGEEGAVAVGRSQGYASPEHYGVDFGDPNATFSMQSFGKSPNAPSVPTNPSNPSNSATSGKKILLTPQSDIYSLGATLYHVMSGVRPAQNAAEVLPFIGLDQKRDRKITQKYSPALVHFIAKAMQPRKENRWQTAAEMLQALNNIRKNDHRIRRFRRVRAAAAAVFTLLFLAGIATSFVGLQQREQLQTALLLAEQSATAHQADDTQAAVSFALSSLEIRHTPQGQLALTNALNVYDLADGFKPHIIVDLPANPLFLAVSPFSEEHAAVIHLGSTTIFNTQTGNVLAILPTVNSALAEVRFLAEDTVIFAGANGLAAHNFITGANLWQADEPATAIAISADKSTVAGIYRDNTFATVHSTANGELIANVDFGGNRQRVVANDIFANPHENLLAINNNATLLAVSFENGELWLYSLQYPPFTNQFFDETSGFFRFDGGFYGDYFAFSAISQGQSEFVVLHTATWEQVGGFESPTPFITAADERGIFVQTANILVQIDIATGEQIPIVTTPYNIAAFAVAADHAIIAVDNPTAATTEIQIFDVFANLITASETAATMVQIMGNTALVATLDVPNVRILRLQTNEHANIFTFNPAFWQNRNHQARLTTDWQRVKIFAIDQFRLYSMDGTLIADVPIPNASEIHDQQFRRTPQGDYLEITYRDGTIRAFSAQDGTVLFEETGAAIDLTLFEVFYTDTLRIESPLHSPPRAYSVATGNFLRELEQDAFLTYVTQAENYIVTQYLRADGSVFGVLLNANGETLAILPYLNDILPNLQNEYRLIFSYPSGNLRESRIYNINQLAERATSQ
ncbi:MAG: serine/threonine protein kinase [Defluviitaleaceae bacterium]|nr:serine/threonine protein kinase [Defluviitaleaceae bacterium]